MIIISILADYAAPIFVFRAAINDALAGKFYSSPGMDGFILTNLNAGMTDASLVALFTQVFLAGPFRLIAWCIQNYFKYIVYQCKKKKKSEKRKTL
jgi:hypothetical protein